MLAHNETERHRVQDIQEYGLDCKNFMIYLQSVEEDPTPDGYEPGVEYRMANRLIKNLDILTGLDSEQPITVSMKSNGGDWNEGMAMYDALLAAPNPITIINYTYAQSMTSIIFQAANKRVMMPHSTFMYHEGVFSTEGTWKQAVTEFEFAKHSEQHMIDIYVDALKRTSHGKLRTWGRKRIGEWLKKQMNHKEEVYLLAQEAVDYGFADEIFSEWETVTVYTEEQLARK